MPKPTKSGRGRLDLKWDDVFVDLLKAAAARLGMAYSSYLRLAATERMERDGFVYQPSCEPPRPPKKPAPKRKPRKRG